jgi:hypothetical protein
LICAGALAALSIQGLETPERDKIGVIFDKWGEASASRRRHPLAMKQKDQKTSRKLGADRNETAVKTRKLDANFKQSRDVREDRGERQIKTSGPRQPPAR